jgi:penicillin-binding protein-related factor A (putative recombinase)
MSILENDVINEKQLETMILDWLVGPGESFAFKLNNVGVYDAKKRCYRKPNSRHIHKGLPDIMGVRDGRFFCVEVKFGKNKPSEHQTKFIGRVLSSGGVAFWCNSFEDFLEKFEFEFGF